MEVKEFKAYRFNSDVVGNCGDCISPPYDIINDDQQEYFYQKNPYNVVRIIKGKTEPSDNEKQNQYTRAAGYLNKWIEKGALKQDTKDSIYGYVQDFQASGSSFQRSSFIALAKLEEFGRIVRPHEQTLSNPIIDRLNLYRACKAVFGLVFMLYDDKKMVADNIIKKAMKNQPLIDFIDEQDVRHRLYAITDEAENKAISQMMADKSCVIADGHHRYTTGLAYAKENPNPAAKYQMIAFVNTQNQGLIVLATHRIVENVKDFNSKKLFEDLEKNFRLTQYKFDVAKDKAHAKKQMLDQMKAEFDKDKNAFGVYTGNKAFYTAVLKDPKAMDRAVTDKSSAWKSLDVAVLHKLILEDILGIGEKQLAAKTNLEYIKDTETAIDDSIANVDKGQKQAAFFMNPPRLEQIEAVADAGEKMPQKSTYFYPKIFTGLTVNKL